MTEEWKRFETEKNFELSSLAELPRRITVRSEDGFTAPPNGPEYIGLAKKKMSQIMRNLQGGKLSSCSGGMILDNNVKLHYRLIEGTVVIDIVVPVGAPVPEEKHEWILERKEDIEDKVVPIIELTDGGTHIDPVTGHVEYNLLGFAVFDIPVGEGALPEEIKTDSSWGGLILATTRLNDGIDGEDLNKDILGIDGGSTYRTGWCYFETSGRQEDYPTETEYRKVVYSTTIEQLQRVDQGWSAYHDEHATEIYIEYLWTYENNMKWSPATIDYDTYSVDPGPPPPEICGYYWTPDQRFFPPPAYDLPCYSDTRHLFYSIVSPGLPIPYGGGHIFDWPPEFNQVIKHENPFVENVIFYPNYLPGKIDPYDLYDAMFDEYWDNGCEAIGLSQYFFPGTFSKNYVRDHTNTRMWGCLYGNLYFSLNDSNDNEFPYIEPTPFVLGREAIGQTAYWRVGETVSGGVFVENQQVQKDFWTQLTYRYPNYYYWDESWGRGLREAIDPARALIYEPSDRVETILEGNAEYPYDPPMDYDPWTDLSGTGETVYHYPPEPDDMIFFGSDEYYIYGGYEHKGSYDGDMGDYGIFTTKTIPDPKQVISVLTPDYVDNETVVYVYSYHKDQSINEAIAHSGGEGQQWCYGIAYRTGDEPIRHYRSNWYTQVGYFASNGILLPEVTEINGVTVYARPKIRAGRLRTHKLTYKKVQVE